jgi:hypothetical protein
VKGARILKVDEMMIPVVRRLGRDYLSQGRVNRQVERRLWDVCHIYWIELSTAYGRVLAKMAEEAGIYECLWRPEEMGICLASQIIGPLEGGLCLLVANKARFEEFNAPNGWGLWENLVLFCAGYLQACRDNPCASVSVSR